MVKTSIVKVPINVDEFTLSVSCKDIDAPCAFYSGSRVPAKLIPGGKARMEGRPFLCN